MPAHHLYGKGCVQGGTFRFYAMESESTEGLNNTAENVVKSL